MVEATTSAAEATPVGKEAASDVMEATPVGKEATTVVLQRQLRDKERSKRRRRGSTKAPHTAG